MEIKAFKIESFGNVELTVVTKGHDVTHKYWGVPKEIIKKFINASSPPTLKQFDDWVSDYKDKETNDSMYQHSSFWSKD